MSQGPTSKRRLLFRVLGPLFVFLAICLAVDLWTMRYLFVQGKSIALNDKSVNPDKVQIHQRDVTFEVSQKLDGNVLSVAATNDNFGDPASGIVKTLRIDYAIDGAAGVRWAKEGQQLIITAPAGKTLEIRHAVYGELAIQPDKPAPGDSGVPLEAKDVADVTRLVQNAVRGGKLAIAASNEALGGDPAFGITKRLSVDYTVDGKPHTQHAEEGNTLRLPADGEGTGALVIVRANWGAPH